MNIRMRLPLLAVALVMGAWLLFDGLRAVATGSYTTPTSGEFAGQLGPWARVVGVIGLDPNGVVMRVVHLLLGAWWLAAAVGELRRHPGASRMLLVAAALTLWYLPVGTIAAIVVIALLLVRRRSSASNPRQSTGRT
jgi:hypothetical protein